MKIYKSYKPKSIQMFKVSESHPGYKLSHLSTVSNPYTPQIL
jgi:hypothetical protein